MIVPSARPAPPSRSAPSCDALRARVFELIDGELDRWTAAELRRHLVRCARCRREQVHAFALLQAVSRAVQIEPAPASLRARVSRGPRPARAEREGASYSGR